MNIYLFGYPLSHSISPAMQNAALREVGLTDWHYDLMPLEPTRLSEALDILRNEDCAGANVTVPHKETIIPLLDGLTPTAESIGAVNTIVKVRAHGGAPKLIGHNTDSAGWLADLYAHDVHISKNPVMVLGAGGSARAIVAACAAVGVSEIRIVARRRAQAEALITDLQVAQAIIYDWTPLDFVLACDDCALIVNTTPIGMSPSPNASPWIEGTPFPPSAFVYDLVYNPTHTLFVQQARREELRANTGLGMLVEQGALAFEQWTGKTAPRKLMHAAAEKKLFTTEHPEKK